MHMRLSNFILNITNLRVIFYNNKYNQRDILAEIMLSVDFNFS